MEQFSFVTFVLRSVLIDTSMSTDCLRNDIVASRKASCIVLIRKVACMIVHEV